MSKQTALLVLAALGAPAGLLLQKLASTLTPQDLILLVAKWTLVTAIAVPSLLILAVIAFLSYQNDFVNRFFVFPKIKLPLPTYRPILGPFVPREPHEDYMIWRDELGPQYLRTMLWIPNLDTSSPIDAREIVQRQNLEKGLMYDGLLDYWGPNAIIVLPNGPNHRRQSALIGAAFRLSVIKEHYHTIFLKHAQALKTYLLTNSKKTGEPINLLPLYDRFALSVFLDCAFSMNINAGGSSSSLARFGTTVDEFVLALRKMIAGTGNPLFLFPGGGWLLANVIYRSSRTTVDRVLYGLIRERRERGPLKDSDGRKDMLDMMIEGEIAGEKKLSDQEIRDAAITLAIAGFETTSTCLAWTSHLLANCDPKFQAKLKDEILSAFPTEDSLGDPEIIQRSLPFTERCLEESLRVRTPVVSAARRAPHDNYPLPSNPEIKLPKNMTVNVAWINLHARKDVWGEDALEFNPSRDWDDANFGGFSKGPRMCLGKAFALHEMKTLVSVLLRDNTFALPKPEQEVGEVTSKAEMTSIGGILRPKQVWLRYL